MGLEETEVVFIMDSARYPVSIYAETEEDGLSLVDKLSSKDSHDDYIEKTVLREIIEKFDERDKKIIYEILDGSAVVTEAVFCNATKEICFEVIGFGDDCDVEILDSLGIILF